MSYEKRYVRWGVWCALGALGSLNGCGNTNEPPLDGRHDTPASSPVTPAPRAERSPNASPSPAADLPLARTSVQLHNGVTRRLGAVAATGRTSKLAADAFLNRSHAILGVTPNELRPSEPVRSNGTALTTSREPGVGLMYDRATGKPKFRLYSYDQHRDGVPVFRSGLRTLVREDGDHPVVWASSAVRPLGDFHAPTSAAAHAVDVDASLRAARRNVIERGGLPPSALTNVSAPTATIFAGTDAHAAKARLAVTYTASDVDGTGKWTFVADAETGDILHVESALHFNVQGTVQAEVVADAAAMECGDLEVKPLPYVEVTSGTNSTFTNAAGAFNVTSPNSGSVSVSAGAAGQFFDILNDAGNAVSATLSVAAPGPANFLFADDTTPPELVLAQLNAYTHANEVRDMLLDYVPDYPVIADQTNFPIHVNRTDFTCETTGGAWYDNDSSMRSLNFCQRTTERTNTAFGSIIHHEFGHHIIDSGGSQQNEYGEGMADAIAMLFAKDPAIGVGYHLNDCAQPLRMASNTCQYSATECSSCGSGIYQCGALISGTVWDIWQQLEASDASSADELIRALVLSSIPMHTGSKIDASIAVDLLTLDDDDGLIENGTPHYDEICAGFAMHGMQCPAIVGGLVVKSADLAAEGPSDGPFAPGSVSYTLYNLGPEQNLNYTVTNPTNATWLGISPTGGTIPLGGQATVTVSIDQAQAALLADGDYTAGVHFTNSTSGVGSVIREEKLRVGAPEPVFTAPFNGLGGFSVGTEYGNLWHAATTCVDALPGHTAGGSLYYGKGDVCNYTTPVPIEHTVVSPVIALSKPDMAEIGFNYLLATENDPNYDSAFVSVSVNDGPFVVVASNNRGGALLNETNGWKPIRFAISDLLPAGPSSIRVQVAFNAGDPTSNTKTGFAVDDLVVYAKVEHCTTNAQCDDGLFCNGTEMCVNQVCTPGTAPTCNDNVECTTDSCNETTDTCINTPGPSCGSNDAFIEVGGTVVIEAEHFAENTPRSSHQWNLVANAQASGQSVMTANPNSNQYINSNYAVTSPELTYRVNFSNTGTYYVWLRGIGPSANDDSCHVGIDNNEVGSSDRITGFTSGLNWTRSTIDGPIATIQVGTAGVHELNLWMREDGFSADKIVLTKSSSFTPTGGGPQESARSGATSGNPCDNVCTNPTKFTSSSYTSPNLGTGASCFETKAALSGGVCGNFVSPRRLYVNGAEVTCNWNPWAVIPPPKNGGYCIQATAGNQAWASFTTW